MNEKELSGGIALPSVDRLRRACQYYAVEPADADDVVWASDLARRVYGGVDVIPREVMLEWFETNPHGFSILKSCAGERLGNLDILPIKKDILRRLVTGDLLERELTRDCIYSDDEKHKIQDLYIESLVVDPAASYAAPGLIKEVLSNFAEIVSRICSPSNVQRLYAIAASNEGHGLLKCLGFESVGNATSRRDEHQLYLGNMDLVSRSINQLLGGHPSASPEPSRPAHESTLALAPSDADAGLKPELASVLFMDIVAFTQLNPLQQLNARQTIEQCVQGSTAFKQAAQESALVARPTGDGLALVFFAHPGVAAKCAVEVAKQLKATALFFVRMGINQGTVYRVRDINGQVDVNGSGINVAQRVMDCGDSGNILLSAPCADALKGTVEWHEFIHPIGRRKIKHGHIIEVFNLRGPDFGEFVEPKPGLRSANRAASAKTGSHGQS